MLTQKNVLQISLQTNFNKPIIVYLEFCHKKKTKEYFIIS